MDNEKFNMSISFDGIDETMADELVHACRLLYGKRAGMGINYFETTYFDSVEVD